MSRDTRLAWLAVVFSGIAAIGSCLLAGAAFWAAFEARQPAKSSLGDAADPVADGVIRTCGIARSSLMRTGDDLFLLGGATGDSQYLSHEERGALVAVSASRARYFLECRLRNLSRVSIFNVTFYTGVSYHGGKKRTRKHNADPIEVIGPGETRTIWIEDKDDNSVIVHSPGRVQYYRFPDMTNLQDQALQPLDDAFWTLKRDADPVPSQ
ncbi:MAG TPA: hypothetical protein VKR56_09800 [Candidatus Cybelea sp.]|nr:hypothetical protein [Candidatus Cybelea sp.]